MLTCVDHVESSGEIREGQKLAVGDAQGHLHIQNIPKRLGSRAKLRCHRITSAVKDGNYVNVCVGPAFVQLSQPSKRCLQCGLVFGGGRMRATVFAEAGCSEEFDKAWWQRKRKYEAGHPTDHGQLLRHRTSTE